MLYICCCQHPVYGEVLLVLPLCNPTCLYWFIHHQYGVWINFIDPVKSSVGRTQILWLFICQPEEGTALHWCHNQCCWWQFNHRLHYVELKCGAKLRLYFVNDVRDEIKISTGSWRTGVAQLFKYPFFLKLWSGHIGFGLDWSSLVFYGWVNFVWSSLIW